VWDGRSDGPSGDAILRTRLELIAETWVALCASLKVRNRISFISAQRLRDSSLLGPSACAHVLPAPECPDHDPVFREVWPDYRGGPMTGKARTDFIWPEFPCYNH
jgi:hypothetical protein